MAWAYFADGTSQDIGNRGAGHGVWHVRGVLLRSQELRYPWEWSGPIRGPWKIKPRDSGPRYGHPQYDRVEILFVEDGAPWIERWRPMSEWSTDRLRILRQDADADARAAIDEELDRRICSGADV